MQVVYTRNSTVAWSANLHSIISGFSGYDLVLEDFPKAMGTQLSMSTAFHPQIDGQSERTIKILEDMLAACVLDLMGSWKKHLPLVEFAYNNSYQASI